MLDGPAVDDGRGARGLEAEHARPGPGHPVPHGLLVAHPVGRNVAGVAHGHRVEIGGAAQLLQHLEGAGLLALQPEGVHRVDQGDGELARRASRAMARASSKFPSMARAVAPCIRAWASLPRAMAPLGSRTTHFMPARAA